MLVNCLVKMLTNWLVKMLTDLLVLINWINPKIQMLNGGLVFG